MHRRQLLSGGLGIIATSFFYPVTQSIAVPPEAWTVEWIIDAAGGGIIGAVAGAGFLALIGADTVSQVDSNVDNIVNKAVQEIEQYVSNALTANDILHAKGRLSGTIDLLQQFHQTKDFQLLERADEEATYSITDIEALGAVAMGIYPLAATIKLSSLAAKFQANMTDGLLETYCDYVVRCDNKFQDFIADAWNEYRIKRIGRVQEIKAWYSDDRFSMTGFRCHAEFKVGDQDFTYFDTLTYPFRMPTQVERAEIGNLAFCGQVQRAESDRATQLLQATMSAAPVQKKYIDAFAPLPEKWAEAGITAFKISRNEFYSKLFKAQNGTVQKVK